LSQYIVASIFKTRHN